MELIQKWLSGKRNFHVGATLYKTFGTDEKLKKLFTGVPDKYKQERLEEALTGLLQKPKVVVQTATGRKETEEMPESADPVLKALRQEWRPWYEKMNYLRHLLDTIEGNEPEDIVKRSQMCGEILELEQQCMHIWERRNYYKQHGELPMVKTKGKSLPDDPFELNNLIDSTKRNIRRNKQLAKKHPEQAVYPMKVKHYEELLTKILEKLRKDEGTKK